MFFLFVLLNSILSTDFPWEKFRVPWMLEDPFSLRYIVFHLLLFAVLDIKAWTLSNISVGEWLPLYSKNTAHKPFAHLCCVFQRSKQYQGPRYQVLRKTNEPKEASSVITVKRILEKEIDFKNWNQEILTLFQKNLSQIC